MRGVPLGYAREGPPTGLYTYPDVSVVCGGPVFEDDIADTLLNPQVLVEVLSDSTEAYDRGKKLAHYRSLPSLREVLLVSQDEVLVDHYVRQPEGAWLLRSMPAGATIELTSIACTLAVDDLYLKVFEHKRPRRLARAAPKTKKKRPAKGAKR